mmetsp:Transcript_22986/g.39465  ORF Transcript_22986/g.39465 Transcript_22986/m.39465 type:complete len:625 (-) Transcript_22986:93-1967(-)|eukprot:CAMPEP_0196659006 /NCGR_PEP_ID=MMETSP1086-20130531/32691_1 /TAXON_ID=77921 /ORGANISM="Cyanoptyche  gloeocystis , Strain SAG4.97" /LENGTH=624 /DNA_ID=CAMNT_0041992819 /DNA_START=67 /DNA_END=1941 /DNA_ORIENTATION=+
MGLDAIKELFETDDFRDSNYDGGRVFDSTNLKVSGSFAKNLLRDPCNDLHNFCLQVYYHNKHQNHEQLEVADIFYVPESSDLEVYGQKIPTGFYVEARPGRFSVVAENHSPSEEEIAVELTMDGEKTESYIMQGFTQPELCGWARISGFPESVTKDGFEIVKSFEFRPAVLDENGSDSPEIGRIEAAFFNCTPGRSTPFASQLETAKAIKRDSKIALHCEMTIHPSSLIDTGYKDNDYILIRPPLLTLRLYYRSAHWLRLARILPSLFIATPILIKEEAGPGIFLPSPIGQPTPLAAPPHLNLVPPRGPNPDSDSEHRSTAGTNQNSRKAPDQDPSLLLGPIDRMEMARHATADGQVISRVIEPSQSGPREQCLGAMAGFHSKTGPDADCQKAPVLIDLVDEAGPSVPIVQASCMVAGNSAGQAMEPLQGELREPSMNGALRFVPKVAQNADERTVRTAPVSIDIDDEAEPKGLAPNVPLGSSGTIKVLQVYGLKAGQESQERRLDLAGLADSEAVGVAVEKMLGYRAEIYFVDLHGDVNKIKYVPVATLLAKALYLQAFIMDSQKAKQNVKCPEDADIAPQWLQPSPGLGRHKRCRTTPQSSAISAFNASLPIASEQSIEASF